MMNDYSAIVEAIDRLTVAVNQNSNTLAAECVSMVLATIGSVAAVLIFEIIKNNIFAPRDEFRKLRRRVNSTMSMYTRYYSNPVNPNRPMMSETTIEDYISAATEMRRMAVDVIAFSDEQKFKKCCGIPVDDIGAAGRELVGLSNSFFSTGESSERDYTKKREYNIKKLLGLIKEC